MSASPAVHDAIAAAHRCYQAGDLAQAEALCRQILVQQAHPVPLGLLALIAQRAGQHDVAVALNRQAIALDANVPAFHANLANSLTALGKFDEAIAAANAALALKPNFATALINLGNAHAARREFDAAIRAYRNALLAEPSNFEAANNLAEALRRSGRFDEAIELLRQAILRRGDIPELHATLGNALKDLGQIDQAINCFRVAATLAPHEPRFASSLLYTLWFDPQRSAAQIVDEHLAWAAVHADPLRDPRPFDNDRNPDRRLRIAYISPDFRSNVIGHYIEPLLANHDRERFEIFCYSDVAIEDAVTQRLRAHAATWRSIVGLSDRQVAEQIRADRIDILIELTAHLAINRLLAMAHKPAPIQISYLAQFPTTGLDAIDYVITDPFLDPPGSREHARTDRLLRLPRTYQIYPAPADAPPVAPPPSLAAGHITFLSVNNFAKVNRDVLALWSRILAAVQGSRLLLRLNGGLAANASARNALRGAGLDPAQVEIIDHLPRDEYLHLFARADIALDPFPYAGYTTTLDTCWMGMPLVTLNGQTSVGRAGVSILSNLELPQLIADTPQRYLQIAIDLANDPPRLTEIRESLRPRMQQSPLTDAPQSARDMEAAYRQMWRRWCGQR